MNVKPRTMFTGDNLPVLRESEPESVDMIHAEPPFNRNRSYAAPIRSKAAGAMSRDTWIARYFSINFHMYHVRRIYQVREDAEQDRREQEKVLSQANGRIISKCQTGRRYKAR